MKSNFLITLEHHELIALSEEDVQRWLNQRLAGKVSNLSKLRVTSKDCGNGYWSMHYLFEATNTRSITENTMKAWLSDRPPYFQIRSIKKFDSEIGEQIK